MKKIITLSLFAALFCAVSCQHGLDNGQEIKDGLKVTAVISKIDESRVDYTPQNTTEPYYIDAFWHVGDVVFGFDNLGKKFNFTVETVEDGVATFNVGSYVPGDAVKLHAIYYPGKDSTNLTGVSPNYSLAVNLDAQSGELDGDSPVLMCATATISDGSVSFAFNNETAIIGVTRFKLPVDATIKSIELEGVVTHGTIAVGDGGSLELTTDETLRMVTATGSWETTSTICNKAVYFASLPTPDATVRINASAGSAVYSKSLSSKTLVAGTYYYTENILGTIDVAQIGETSYSTIDAAWAAANEADSAVTITLLASCSTESRLPIPSGAKITLDLNGHVLSVSQDSLISPATNTTVTITDSKDKVGKITSSEARVVVLTTYPINFTISKCIIECTKASGNWVGEPIVKTNSNCGTTKTVLNIDDARLVATNSVTGLSVYAGTITITDSEISSGTESEGNYAIVSNFVSDHSSSTLTINSGSFYTSASSGTLPSALHRSSSYGTITIKSGYYYGDGRVVSKGGSVSGGFTVSGGYFSHDPEAKSNFDTGAKTLKDCDVNHVHATTGDNLHYSKKVAK